MSPAATHDSLTMAKLFFFLISSQLPYLAFMGSFFTPIPLPVAMGASPSLRRGLSAVCCIQRPKRLFRDLSRGDMFSLTEVGTAIHKKKSRATFAWNGNQKIVKPIRPETIVWT